MHKMHKITVVINFDIIGSIIVIIICYYQYHHHYYKRLMIHYCHVTIIMSINIIIISGQQSIYNSTGTGTSVLYPKYGYVTVTRSLLKKLRRSTVFPCTAKQHILPFLSPSFHELPLTKSLHFPSPNPHPLPLINY